LLKGIVELCFNQPGFEVIIQVVVEKVLSFVQSPLLQNESLQSLKELFGSILRIHQASYSYSFFLDQLLVRTQNVISKRCLYSIAEVIAELNSLSSSHNTTIEKFLNDLSRPNDEVCCIADKLRD
jgi:hypothetical protein